MVRGAGRRGSEPGGRRRIISGPGGIVTLELGGDSGSRRKVEIGSAPGEVEGAQDEILKEIAVLKPCTKAAGKKVYHLREGLETEYNMFYYGYSKEQQTAAQVRNLMTLKLHKCSQMYKCTTV